MSYTLAQCYSFALQGGWPQDKARKAAGIAILESSGNAGAVNGGIVVNGVMSNEYSVGLWQINTKVHKNYTVAQLKDPLTNAREAYRIYKMQGWNAWFLSNGKYESGYKNVKAQSLALGGSTATPLVVTTANVNQVIADLGGTAHTKSGHVVKDTGALSSDYLIYGVIGFMVLGLVVSKR